MLERTSSSEGFRKSWAGSDNINNNSRIHHIQGTQHCTIPRTANAVQMSNLMVQGNMLYTKSHIKNQSGEHAQNESKQW